MSTLWIRWGGPGDRAFEPLDLSTVVPDAEFLLGGGRVYVEDVIGDARAEVVANGARRITGADDLLPTVAAIEIDRQGPAVLRGTFDLHTEWYVLGDMTGDGRDDILGFAPTLDPIFIVYSATGPDGSWVREEVPYEGLVDPLWYPSTTNVSLTRVGRPGLLVWMRDGLPERFCDSILRMWSTAQGGAVEVHEAVWRASMTHCNVGSYEGGLGLAALDGEILAVSSWGGGLYLWCLQDARVELCADLLPALDVGAQVDQDHRWGFSRLLDDPDAPGVLMASGGGDGALLYLPLRRAAGP